MLLINAKAFGVTSMATEICNVLNRQSHAGSLLGPLNCLLRALHLVPFSEAFFILGLSKSVDALELSCRILSLHNFKMQKARFFSDSLGQKWLTPICMDSTQWLLLTIALLLIQLDLQCTAYRIWTWNQHTAISSKTAHRVWVMIVKGYIAHYWAHIQNDSFFNA